MKKRIAVAIFATLTLSLTIIAADMAGTWKLNVQKSKLGKSNTTTSQIMKITRTGPDTFTTTIDWVLKSGEKRHQEIHRVMDGKEHPATGVGLQGGGTEIVQQVDASTRKVTQKRDGKVMSEFTS